jgi:membrane protease YdiL (CAAX protease family)
MRAGLIRSAAAPPRLALALACVLLLALAAWGGGALRLITLLVLAPLLEETVFRAGLQEALLRRWPRLPQLANVATAAAFGLAHVVLRGDVAAFAVALPALLIGVVYQRSGRLRHCVLLHAAMNAMWLAWSMAAHG